MGRKRNGRGSAATVQIRIGTTAVVVGIETRGTGDILRSGTGRTGD